MTRVRLERWRAHLGAARLLCSAASIDARPTRILSSPLYPLLMQRAQMTLPTLTVTPA